MLLKHYKFIENFKLNNTIYFNGKKSGGSNKKKIL